jgi:hypothetical protein
MRKDMLAMVSHHIFLCSVYCHKVTRCLNPLQHIYTIPVLELLYPYNIIPSIAI